MFLVIINFSLTTALIILGVIELCSNAYLIFGWEARCSVSVRPVVVWGND